MRTLFLLVLPSIAMANAPLALTQQGRLLDTSGAPINGAHDLRVTLYDTVLQEDPGLWTRAYPSYPFASGYYAVSLVLDDDEQPLDTADFDDGEVWVGLAVDGTAIGDRQRLGSVPFAISARNASSGGATVPIVSGPSGACAIGTLVYDAAVGRLRTCTTGTWTAQIEDTGSFRRWSDNTHAASCNAYRYPSGDRVYDGQIGSGVYRIEPEGSAIDVYCDMDNDGGGWTLVSRVIRGANIATTGAAGSTPFMPTQSGFAKLSDATIAAIRSDTSYGGPTNLRVTCEFSTERTQYCSSSCNFGSNNVVNLTPGCGQCSQSFEGSLTALTPNEGTRGIGHHHLPGWFAYQSTHYSSQGCHSDDYNGINNGNASGTLWVK